MVSFHHNSTTPAEDIPQVQQTTSATINTTDVATTTAMAAKFCVNAENLIKMQERIAWLEANLGDANKQIEELFTKIDKLECQVRYLASITEPPPAVRALTEETPPPHY